MPDDNAIVSKSLQELFSQYRFIIPEIQREYVWGDPQIGNDVLCGFFSDLLNGFEGYQRLQERVDQEVPVIRAALESQGLPVDVEQIRRGAEQRIEAENGAQRDPNVGFLYAYLPGYANARNVLPGNLIDGQQRLTTLVLVWLYIAKKSGRMAEFLGVMRPGGNLRFDFKVRQRTHGFLCTLVDKVAEEGDFDFAGIDDVTWFLTKYKSDVSIRSMVNTLKQWHSVWADRAGAGMCYDYLANKVRFWLFIVQNTIQGEKLYITMNGRGKGLTQAEIIRARVFQGVPDMRAADVGRMFEKIYDFFWTHPMPGELTADAGVQKFFRWVYLLDRYNRWRLQGNGGALNEHAVEIEEFRAALQNQVRGERRVFELKDAMFIPATGIGYELIKKTYEALNELYEHAVEAECNGFCLDECLPATLLTAKADASSFQQDSMLLLPLLRWLSNQYDEEAEACLYDSTELVRLARYLRNQISLKSVQKSINTVVAKAIELADVLTSGDGISLADCIRDFREEISDTLVPDEEVGKVSLIRSTEDMQLRSRAEALIWEIEDYKCGDSAMSPTDNGYKVGQILSTVSATWAEETLTEEFIDDLQRVWQNYREFVRVKEQNPDWVTEWLLYPSHQGYREHGGRLLPLSKLEILEKPQLLRSISALVSRSQEQEDRGAGALAREQAEFLRNYWARLGDVDNPMTLAAMAIAVGSLCGRSGIEAGWTQLEFKSDLPEGYGDHGDCIKIGQGDRGKYFWRLPTTAAQRHSVPRHNCILPYHCMTQQDVDETVAQHLDHLAQDIVSEEIRNRFSWNLNDAAPAVQGHHRNMDRYYFNGDNNHCLYKNELVKAIVRRFVQEHPDCTENGFYQVFPKDLKGRTGIITRVDSEAVNRDPTRWYMSDEDRLHLVDAEMVASNQWGKSNEFDRVLLIARELGYTIDIAN